MQEWIEKLESLSNNYQVIDEQYVIPKTDFDSLISELKNEIDNTPVIEHSVYNKVLKLIELVDTSFNKAQEHLDNNSLAEAGAELAVSNRETKQGLTEMILPIKTAKISLTQVKDSDGWGDLAHELLYEKYKKENPTLDEEEELPDSFYENITSKKFKYGEFADLEIIVDQDFNIVGGTIL